MASLASRAPAPGAPRVIPRARATRRRAARASAADTERLPPRDASTRPEDTFREPASSSACRERGASTTEAVARDPAKRTRASSRRAMLAAAVSAPLASAAGGALATGAVDAPVDPRSYFQDVPTLFAPLYGEDSRETRLIEIVPGEVYALEQNLALGPLETPLRCVVVKLKDGTTWVHAPLAPTNEFFELAESVGPVKHVVVPTYALEHKIFAKPALERWPSAKLWVAPGQFSFPVNVPAAKVFGREPDGVLGVRGDASGDACDGAMTLPGETFTDVSSLTTKNASDPPWLDEIACDVLRCGRFAIAGQDVTLYEATFLHKKSKTLIVTDCVAYVPRAIPVLQTPEKLLLVGKRSTDDPQPPDTFENRVAGWKKMALLVTYFFPEHEELVRPGLVEWSDGWEENFDALAERLLVPPVVRATLYNQNPERVKTYVDRVCKEWEFDKVVPAHWAGPVAAGPAEFERAFRFLEDNSLDAFPEGDMKRGLKPIADSVARR
jgi:hypothetical protein